MEQLIYTKTYEEYREELKGELTKAAESFVRIGYLLKVARDTDVLATSGYDSVTEFARAEFGIDKTQVSRFIHINDRFAENGYSDKLMDEYRGYGYAKLTIMLQLPEAINEELTPNYSKAEIQALKDEIDEENKVSDIERVLEAANPLEKGLEELDEYKATLFKAVLQLGEDDPELYIKISERKNENIAEILTETMAPSGEKTYSIRVRGIGRLLLMISDMSEYVKLVNSRTGEKMVFTWNDVAQAWIYAGVLGPATESRTPEECWELRYEKRCPIAPVQQNIKPTIGKSAKKDTKVSKAPKQKKEEKAWGVGRQETLHALEESIPEPEEKETEEKEFLEAEIVETVVEEQIPGQDSIDEHEEWMPDKTVEDVSEQETMEEQQGLDQEMLGAARNSYSNLKIAMENRAYKEALADARHLVHYLEKAGVER